jgi:hypothetical protein
MGTDTRKLTLRFGVWFGEGVFRFVSINLPVSKIICRGEKYSLSILSTRRSVHNFRILCFSHIFNSFPKSKKNREKDGDRFQVSYFNRGEVSSSC